jgi:hypothetical protein
MIVNGKQIPTESLTVDPSHEKTTTLAYKTLYESFDIHHSNSELQIIHDMYINGHFKFLFDLPPNLAASEGHFPGRRWEYTHWSYI